MQVDRFVHDRLPPTDQWPVFLRQDTHATDAKPFNLVVALLEEAMHQPWADQPLFRTVERNMTYREVLAQVNQRVHVLRQHYGLPTGQRVLIRGQNSIDSALAWLAVVKAGLVAVMTMPLLRAKELGDIIALSQPALALCEASRLPDLLAAQSAHPVLKHVLSFGDPHAFESLESVSQAWPATSLDSQTTGEDVALLAFTSGTTGQPKAACHAHRDVWLACQAWPIHVLRARTEDVVMGTPPLAFTFGLGGLLLFPMVAGASVFFPEGPMAADRMVEAMSLAGCTICYTAPTFYRQMTPLIAQHRVTSLRMCVSAGEALPEATRQGWRNATGLELLDGIGATEMFHIFISSPTESMRSGSLGRVVPGYEACVLDPSGQVLAPGHMGRLAVRGPTGCRYLQDKRQSSYVQHGWNITGDTVTQDPDGYFFYHARSDDMIVSAGYNIGGPEVEDALLTHPAVAECAVIGKPDASRGMVVKAFCVLRDGFEPNPECIKALQDHVKQHLAPYKYPREIVFVSSLPRTPTGKLQRFKLRDHHTP